MKKREWSTRSDRKSEEGHKKESGHERETEGGKFDVNVKSMQTIHKSKWREKVWGRKKQIIHAAAVR